MKKLKLNKKGFTLIELLAVIVILAVIMAVTIPTVLNTMGDARQNTLETSAQTLAEWIEKEYSLALIGNADSAFTTMCGTTGSTCATYTTTVDNKTVTNTYNASYLTKDNIKAAVKQQNKDMYYGATADTVSENTKVFMNTAGLDYTNYDSAVVMVVDGGRACVMLHASESGDFGNVDKPYVFSTGCNGMASMSATEWES